MGPGRRVPSGARDGKQPFPVKDCTTDTLLPHLAEKAPPGCVFVLKDFHHAWTQKKAYITRKLRNMAPKLRANGQYMIFTTPQLDLPVELKDDVVVVYVPLPDQAELERLFDAVTGKLDRSKLPRPEVEQKLIASAKGLTTNQARLAFSRVYAQHGCFDERGIALVTWAKQQVIRESGALEFWPAEQGEADVGGLDLMKTWLKKREVGFSAEARAANVPYPRGVALIGIPGTGKSLSAKMLSGLWKLPLLRPGRRGFVYVLVGGLRRGHAKGDHAGRDRSAPASFGSTRWRRHLRAPASDRSTRAPPPACSAPS